MNNKGTSEDSQMQQRITDLERELQTKVRNAFQSQLGDPSPISDEQTQFLYRILESTGKSDNNDTKVFLGASQDVERSFSKRVVATALWAARQGRIKSSEQSLSRTPRYIVNTAAAQLLSKPRQDELRYFYRMAAMVMQQMLYKEAMDNRDGTRQTIIEEELAGGSFGAYAGGWDSALRLNDYWVALSTEDPQAAEIFALARFCGRTSQEIQDILGLTEGQVAQHLKGCLPGQILPDVVDGHKTQPHNS
jgi:hypothetical protein